MAMLADGFRVLDPYLVVDEVDGVVVLHLTDASERFLRITLKEPEIESEAGSANE